MHPILLEVGPLTLHSLWVMVALGFIAGLMMLYYLSLKTRSKIKVIFNHLLYLFIFAMIGARLIFILTNWQLFFFEFQLTDLITVLYIWDKGLSFWGMALGIAVSIFIIARQYKENIAIWLDNCIIALMTATIFGNIGAFLDGLNYGNETSLPWGIAIESGTIKYSVPIHPTQIYAALYSLVIVAALLYLRNRKFATIPGNLTALGVILYSVGVFLEGFVRGDDTIVLFYLRLEQIAALLSILTTTVLWRLWRKKQEKKET